jgi:nicotinamide riboside kinase
MIKLAILGAESSGKSTLARQLAMTTALEPDKVELMPEPLRLWCADHQRAPSAIEQVSLMASHIQQCEQAMEIPSDKSHNGRVGAKAHAPAPVLICDTTALQTAAYQFYYFGDTSLDRDAIAHHQRFDFTLLMGLDLPWVADPGQRTGPVSQAPVDQRLRFLLEAAQCPYAVIYGTGAQRLDRALAVLSRLKPVDLDFTTTKVPARILESARPIWRPHCETCGNAECEHRLFRDLKGLS